MLKTTTSVEGLAKSLGTTAQGFIKFCQSIKDGDIQLQTGTNLSSSISSRIEKDRTQFQNYRNSRKGILQCNICDLVKFVPSDTYHHYKLL